MSKKLNFISTLVVIEIHEKFLFHVGNILVSKIFFQIYFGGKFKSTGLLNHCTIFYHYCYSICYHRTSYGHTPYFLIGRTNF